MFDPIRRLQYSLLLLLGIFIAGTLGYMILERWNLLDSLYMTVIILSTIGFREVHDMTTPGRIFTIVLIIGGVGTAAYVIRTAVGIILEGEIREILGRRKVDEKIRKLKGHYIICGYGRMGKHICSEFEAAKFPYVVIEKDPEVVIETQTKGLMVIQGDATHDEVIRSAGIDQAAGLIAVLNTDAENLFVVLSAREMNPTLRIITRAAEERAEQKLKRAGATLVVSPYAISALRIAQTIFRPHVTSFLDSAVSRGANIDFRLDSIQISADSPYNGAELGRSKIREELGILIVAIEKEDGRLMTSLSPKTVLEKGDQLICVGKPAQLEEMARLAQR